MTNTQSDERPRPRDEQEVFNDLANLCTEPGFIHAIALLCSRDNFVSYKNKLSAKDLLPRFSQSTLIRTEFATLIGLMIRGNIDTVFPGPEVLRRQVDSAERLLAEIHDAVSFQAFQPLLRAMAEGRSENPMSDGMAMREAIFYGAESAYPYQYQEYVVPKYSADNSWLVPKIGFSIEEARDVIAYMVGSHTEKVMTSVYGDRSSPPWQRSILDGFCFTVDEVSSKSGVVVETVRHVFDALATGPRDGNATFRAIGDFNSFNSKPLLRLDDGRYMMPLTVSLIESLYESPFYWMLADKEYKSRASTNRGLFAERMAFDFLVRVFGRKQVFHSVEIFRGNERVGEIDVLVLFGDRGIVLQAKSKRLTIEARRGNAGQLEDDFKNAVQSAYEQAFSCAEFLWDSSCVLKTKEGAPVLVPRDLKEVLPICVVADHYPSLAFQSHQFLKLHKSARVRRPYVIDIFTLDILTEMLSTPLRMLSYLDRRALVGAEIMSSHELTILAYHLRSNLWVEAGTTVMLTDDIAADLDVAILARRGLTEGDGTPKGILKALLGTTLGHVIEDIQSAPEPAAIELGLFLLTLSGDTCKNLSLAIDKLCAAWRRDKSVHDCTLYFDKAGAGITIHCSDAPDHEARERLLSHAEIRKYSCKAEKWFGLALDPVSRRMRFSIMGMYPWKKDDELDRRLASISRSPVFTDMKSLHTRVIPPFLAGIRSGKRSCGHRQLLPGGEAAERHVRSFVVVRP